MANSPNTPFLRVISPQKLGEMEIQTQIDKSAPSEQTAEALTPLVSYVRSCFREARDARATTGLSERLINSLRIYRGEYSEQKMQEIKLFGGSEVYSKVTASKCRGATAILRDLYLSASDQPWALEPTPKPTVPNDISGSIKELVNAEVQNMQSNGVIPTAEMLEQRFTELFKAAQIATNKEAEEAAEEATRRINDMLVEGRFYESLREFLIDLPIFPIACMKGPVVRNHTKVRWLQGKPVKTFTPKMFWLRVSPLDLYFTPDASNIAQSNVYEHVRFTKQELYNMIGVPGYDEKAIRRVLDSSKAGVMTTEWRDWFESVREKLEDRNSSQYAEKSGRLINGVEFHGCVSGEHLLAHGMTDKDIADPMAEYFVDLWLVDDEIIKVHINPARDSRPNYYITSFEKMPGNIYGYSLPDILEDIQSVLNATMRSLVNNMAIASGPQGVINVDRLAPGENPNQMHPWKLWHVIDDPYGNKALPPISFFQPNANAEQLLRVYEKFSALADEESALPRYMTGGERASGAGRTASGLAMLMDNASKVMQSVAANIDDDVLGPALEALYELLLITQSQEELVRGDETVRVRGVTVAVQRETDRMRKMEFLSMTANPIDMGIIGPTGRAAVLRDIADTLGMQGDKIVPSQAELENKEKQAAAAAAAGPPPGFGAPNAKPEAPRAGPEQVRQPFENQGVGARQ